MNNPLLITPTADNPDAPKLYTPNQVMVATLLGGVLPGCYLIWRDFRVLNEAKKANQTMMWGLIGFFGIAGIAYLFPQIPATALSVSLAIAFKQITPPQSFWRTDEAKQVKKQSWWFAILIGLAGLLISIAIILLVSFGIGYAIQLTKP